MSATAIDDASFIVLVVEVFLCYIMIKAAKEHNSKSLIAVSGAITAIFFFYTLAMVILVLNGVK